MTLRIENTNSKDYEVLSKKWFPSDKMIAFLNTNRLKIISFM